MAVKRSAAKRLDQTLVELGLADSLDRARALIMAGRVTAGGRPTRAAGERVSAEDDLQVELGAEFVGRGGIKLAAALDHFGLDVAGAVALDVGASTGGFTDCLLQRGAARVYAVDAGYGQMDYRLRQDSSVTVMERVNARKAFTLPEKIDLATVDVSFISVTRVLPSIAAHLKDYGRILLLVKPQFEARRNEVGRGGVVKDPTIHARVLARVIAWAVNGGYRLVGLTPSALAGSSGNREFFVLLTPPQTGFASVTNPAGESPRNV